MKNTKVIDKAAYKIVDLEKALANIISKGGEENLLILPSFLGYASHYRDDEQLIPEYEEFIDSCEVDPVDVIIKNFCKLASVKKALCPTCILDDEILTAVQCETITCKKISIEKEGVTEEVFAFNIQ
ncbi:hypothetical protein M2146_001104 [Lachnospiraceae bacterium PF1-22]